MKTNVPPLMAKIQFTQSKISSGTLTYSGYMYPWPDHIEGFEIEYEYIYGNERFVPFHIELNFNVFKERTKRLIGIEL